MTKPKYRNLSLEWLRIFSMFLIILLHSIDHSGLLESLVPGNFLYFVEMFFYVATQVCVNCFVMISGYFLITSKFRISKLLNLWVEVVFYSLVIKLVMMATGEIPFSISSLVSCLVPFMTGRYWFVTIYFGLYLLSPFLNLAIRAMNQKQLGQLNLVLGFLGSVMVSIHPDFKGMNFGGGWGLAWFVVLYLAAAYLRLYGIPFKKLPALAYFGIYLLTSGVGFAAIAVSEMIGHPALVEIAKNAIRYDHLLSYLGTLALMCGFLAWEEQRKAKLGENAGCPKWISTLSATTFGVYLIHAHANVCIPEYWQLAGILELQKYPLLYPLYQIGLVIAIFLVCALLDYLRSLLFGAVKVEKLISKVDQLFAKDGN